METKQKVVSTQMDPSSPDAIINNPIHGIVGRRVRDKNGRSCYDLVWYHSTYGWMDRNEALEIWKKISIAERMSFPSVQWWP